MLRRLGLMLKLTVTSPWGTPRKVKWAVQPSSQNPYPIFLPYL